MENGDELRRLGGWMEGLAIAPPNFRPIPVRPEPFDRLRTGLSKDSPYIANLAK
jgi:hypothetical protein